MSSLVSIERHEIPQETLWHVSRIALRLGSLLRHEIPAFILRSGNNKNDPLAAHEQHSRILGYTLTSVYPAIPNTELSIGYGEPRPHSTGYFHADTTRSIAISPDDPLTEPELYTVLSGGGSVHVAHIGTVPRLSHAIADANTSPLDMTHANHPHNALLRGRLDPRIVDPNVFVGNLVAGDSIVMAGSSGRFATWHKFNEDRNLGQSLLVGTIFVPQQEIGPRQGFDLGPQ